MRYVAARIVMARKIIKATGTILRYGARVLTCVSECCVCVFKIRCVTHMEIDTRSTPSNADLITSEDGFCHNLGVMIRRVFQWIQ